MKNTVKVELVVLLSDFHVVEYLGVGYIKAYLESKGIETTIDTVKPEEIDALIAKVRENKISIVGFAAYSNTILSVLNACRKLKSALPYVHITLGGPQVASYSKKILEENAFIDSVIEGEGEFAFYDLASHIESAESLSGIKGLTYRDQNGEIIQNAPSEWIDNLDVLPFPDRTKQSRFYVYIRRKRLYGQLYILQPVGCTSPKRRPKSPKPIPRKHCGRNGIVI